MAQHYRGTKGLTSSVKNAVPFRLVRGPGRDGRDHSREHRPTGGTPTRDLSFVPVHAERVLEVKYERMEGTRFRHLAHFVRGRNDRSPRWNLAGSKTG